MHSRWPPASRGLRTRAIDPRTPSSIRWWPNTRGRIAPRSKAPTGTGPGYHDSWSTKSRHSSSAASRPMGFSALSATVAVLAGSSRSHASVAVSVLPASGAEWPTLRRICAITSCPACPFDSGAHGAVRPPFPVGFRPGRSGDHAAGVRLGDFRLVAAPGPSSTNPRNPQDRRGHGHTALRVHAESQRSFSHADDRRRLRGWARWRGDVSPSASTDGRE